MNPYKMVDVQGVRFTGIKIVSEVDGGTWEGDKPVKLYSNGLEITIDTEFSDCLLSVCHIEDGSSLWEIKEVGPFVYFSIFRIKELMGHLPAWGAGAFGSKYLGVSSGGWSSRAECFNELGYCKPVIEVTLINSNGHKTIAHITKRLAIYLMVEFDAHLSYPSMSVQELIDEIEKESVYSRCFFADTVSDPSIKFANHGSI